MSKVVTGIGEAEEVGGAVVHGLDDVGAAARARRQRIGRRRRSGRDVDCDRRADHGVVPLRIVKVSVPSLTTPAALVTVALEAPSSRRR